MRFHPLIAACLLLALAACGDSKDRVAYDEPGYVKGTSKHPAIKVGSPYKVMGKTYIPKYNPTYRESGLASWYGPDFHGKSTANGERYNQYAMTAAHKTLPMPSIVKVTHNKTGKSVLVRINDRGPFSEGRIIDLSKAAAEELGIVREGVAGVRVEYMQEETNQYIAKLNLKKPATWGEYETASTDRVLKAPKPKPIGSPTEHIPAESDPEIYEPELGEKPITTIQARGIEMEEIGYKEDAFSVLSESQYSAATPSATRASSGHAYEADSYASDPALEKPPDTESGNYYVQAGSFGKQANAETFAKRLAELSAVEIEEVMVGEHTFYRVLLGPTASYDTAEGLIAQLIERDIVDGKVIRK
jgi:rare lipoprotein A